MKTIMSIVAAAVVVMMFGVGATPASAANANQPEYWENQGAHPAQCYKHGATGSNEHGGVTNDNKAVTLNAFNQSWYGDHWEILIVNGGSNDTVIQHPVAGVAYYPPLNGGGQQPDISHWIVCKGETPVTTTEPPVTEPPTTPPTTICVDCSPNTQVITTPTTEPTSTAPESTFPPESPPLAPPGESTTTTTTIVATGIPPVPPVPGAPIPPPPAVTGPTTLPSTGADDPGTQAAIAALVLGGGAGLALISRRRRI